MARRDLRNLPDAVIRRLSDAGQYDSYGIRHRGALLEAGWDQRARLAGNRVECRADNDDENPVLDGYATVYDHSYEVMGGAASGWGWDETISAGACDKSVSERDDVYLLLDHDGLPLASTKAGTLTLTSDKVGLLSIGRPDMKSAYNGEVVMRVRSGELDAMSFAFVVTRQEWNGDYTERFITELKLYDVSVVKWPANPATHIHARNVDNPVSAGHSLVLAQAQAEALRLVHV